MRHVLHRAICFDATLHADYVDGDLDVGDRFVQLCDGVWVSLNSAEIEALLTSSRSAQGCAAALCDAALAAGSSDNVSAVLVDIHVTGANTFADLAESDRHFAIPEVVTLGVSLLKGLLVLHRQELLHRDIKPGNVDLGADGQSRILGLGVSQSAAHRGTVSSLKNLDQSASSSADALAGTLSFLANEQFEGAPPARGTDLYAEAVTLYHTLTRRYPHGEIEPFHRPRFSEPLWPTRVRRDILQWLENVVLKGVCKDPRQRFGTCEEFVLALERVDAQPLPSVELPLSQSDPLKLRAMDRHGLAGVQSAAAHSSAGALKILAFA